MRITYLILAHSDPEQLEKMIEALNHENVDFIIHIDSKSDINAFFTQKLLGFTNLTFLKKRFSINWGGFNMVEATLYMMKTAVRKNKKGYLVLLSGQDFPIKPAHYIYEFLRLNYGNQYIEHFSLPSKVWAMNGGVDRLAYYWFIDKLGLNESGIIYEIQRNAGRIRPYFQNFIPYGGSQWWALTCECVHYVLKYVKLNRIYKEFYELTFIPDEMFFQSIVLNSPFKEKVMNTNLRYIDWDTGPDYPKVLTGDDLQVILESGKLWARKFSSAKDAFILDQIESILKNETLSYARQ